MQIYFNQEMFPSLLANYIGFMERDFWQRLSPERQQTFNSPWGVTFCFEDLGVVENPLLQLEFLKISELALCSLFCRKSGITVLPNCTTNLMLLLPTMTVNTLWIMAVLLHMVNELSDYQVCLQANDCRPCNCMALSLCVRPTLCGSPSAEVQLLVQDWDQKLI